MSACPGGKVRQQAGVPLLADGEIEISEESV